MSREAHLVEWQFRPGFNGNVRRGPDLRPRKRRSDRVKMAKYCAFLRARKAQLAQWLQEGRYELLPPDYLAKHYKW